MAKQLKFVLVSCEPTKLKNCPKGKEFINLCHRVALLKQRFLFAYNTGGCQLYLKSTDVLLFGQNTRTILWYMLLYFTILFFIHFQLCTAYASYQLESQNNKYYLSALCCYNYIIFYLRFRLPTHTFF